MSEDPTLRPCDWDRRPLAVQLARMNAHERAAADLVAAAAPQVAAVVEAAVGALRGGGRLVYLGAGTSGRLAALDAAEVPPTFGVPAGTVVAVVAGGAHALRDAAEDLEDDEAAAAADLAALDAGPADLVVGVSASGRTPYTLAGLRAARAAGARTAAVVCAADAPMAAEADLAVVVPVGPEVVRGSTRLAAGTAQKLVLNQVSTLTMVRLGHVYGDLMIGVLPENAKLRARALENVVRASGADRGAARAALDAAGGDAKAAVTALRTGLDAGAAADLLRAAGGDLRAALGERGPVAPGVRVGVDVGGSKVLAAVVDDGGCVLGTARRDTGTGGRALPDVVRAVVGDALTAAGVPPESLRGLGIGVPGLVDPEAGTVALAVNAGVGAAPLDLAGPLRAALGVPVRLDNDVNAAALGAARALGAAGRDLAYLAVGTGLAAGLVLDGALRRGASGAAGELGHLAVVPDGERCACGGRGCLETVASGGAVTRALRALGIAAPRAGLLFAHDAPDAVRAVRDRFVDHLALAVRLLVLTADPRVVVLGGGVAEAGEPLRAAVAAALGRDATGSAFLDGLHLADRLVLPPAGVPVAAVGAALLLPGGQS